MIPIKVFTVFENVLPMMILFAVTYILIRAVCIIYGDKELDIANEVKSLLYQLYIFALFSLVSSTDFQSLSNNFIPFREITRYSYTSVLFYRNVIGNILLFVPFGFMITDVLKSAINKTNIFITTFITAISSTVIEIIQLYIGRSFDIDDIILNILGGIVGYLIFRIIHPIIEKNKKIINILLTIGIFALLIVVFFFMFHELYEVM